MMDASYVGQTGRQLKKTIVEHRNHINRNTTLGWRKNNKKWIFLN